MDRMKHITICSLLRPLLVVILLCAAVVAQGAAISDPAAQHLDAALEVSRTTYNLPGVGAAIITDDDDMWEGAAGYADLKSRRPVETDTLFSIGSITKTFIAALTLKCVEQDMLALDDSIGTWLSDLPPNAASNIDPAITIRQLLNHTSGIASYTERMIPWFALALNPERRFTHTEVMRLIGPPKFAPGEGWYYSNSNYYILGMILEQVTGAPITEELHAKIFDPLELRATFLDAAEDVSFAVARGYKYRFGRNLLDPLSVHRTGTYSLAWTAGAMVSRPMEIARFFHELFGGNLLSADSLDAMLTTVPADTDGVEYGLGIMKLAGTPRGTIWMHGGMINGYTATVWRVPSEKVTIAVTANRSGAAVDDIAAALLDAFIDVR